MLNLITRAHATLNSLRSEDGNAAEYGLIIAGVAVVIIAGLAALALGLNTLFKDVATKL